MRTLLIDNHDSFTWNLSQYFAQACGQEPLVVRNDALTWEEIVARGPFDAIVISPGPGTVEHAQDFRVSHRAITESDVPLLGVCLGHQGIAWEAGARIALAPEPVHGRVDTLLHDADPLFDGIPSPCRVVRYHSLVVQRPLPPSLTEIARTADGLVMALRNRARMQWGVQFHPESILSEHGHRLVRNFRDIALAARRHRPVAVPRGDLECGQTASAGSGARADARAATTNASMTGTGASVNRPQVNRPQAATRIVHAMPLRTPLEAEDLFHGLYRDADCAFWLDSARLMDGLSRFSFLGAAAPESVLTLRLDQHRAASGAGACDRHGDQYGAGAGAGAGADADDGDGDGDAFLHRLDSFLAHSSCGGDDLPFDFRGGLVGFLGYECKALFGADAAHGNPYPDAAWMPANRFVAVDHVERHCWAVAVCEDCATAHDAAHAWLQDTAERVAALPAVAESSITPRVAEGALRVTLEQDRARYVESIQACRRAIRDGESYQICLTNRLRIDASGTTRGAAPDSIDGLALYRQLRRHNPAPFSAYLRIGALQVLSVSPERFLRVDRSGLIQTRPIKGTSRRDADPAVDRALVEELRQSAKNRAENLMIVDLMRNDLGRVSRTGTVRVPRLMDIESHPTVHQMVSTVEGELRDDKSLVDLLRATFPGGSISGAPKERAMQYIDALERSARGVYCGCIGLLGYDRVMDLSIAIRTIAQWRGELIVGAGGGITHLSDPDEEFDEMLLKAEALVRAIGLFLGRDTEHWTEPEPCAAG